MRNATEQQDHNFTWRKQQKLTVVSTDIKAHWLLLAGLMFEMAGLTCEVGLRPGENRISDVVKLLKWENLPTS